jgi:hypothetical protein
MAGEPRFFRWGELSINMTQITQVAHKVFDNRDGIPVPRKGEILVYMAGGETIPLGGFAALAFENWVASATVYSKTEEDLKGD